MDEFLEHCYVTPSEYETSQREESTRGERKAFTREFYNEVDIQAEAAITRKGVNTSLLDFAPQEPIIILGNVGVGKSIFIDYLMYKERTYLSRAYVARVNFKNVSTLNKDDIEMAVATEVCAAMYRGGYDCKDKGKLSDIFDMLQVYILSPWTKVVKWKSKTKTYEVFDEVTRSHFLGALLKSNALDHDSETNQFIGNLFSLNEMDAREHFLSLAILHKMKTVTPSGSTYHTMKDILEWGRSYEFNDQQVFNKILELEAGKLIEPIDLAAHSDETMEGMATSYRIRPRGNFHFELASDCGYVEEMAKVTPILSQEVSHYELNKETGVEARC